MREASLIRQKNAPKPLSGWKALILLSRVMVYLAVGQMVIHLAAHLTGMPALYMLMYVLIVWIFSAMVKDAAASCSYTLRKDELVLQRQMGDVITVQEHIPLDRIRVVRALGRAEDLALYTRRVRAIDRQCAAGVRMRAAFAASLLSARLARLIAGKRAKEQSGYAIIYGAGKESAACVFRPNEEMLTALREAVPQAFESDERAQGERLSTIRARALQRAFPEAYPYVLPLVDEAELAWARELKAHKKRGKQAKKENKPKRAAKEKKRSPKDAQAAVMPPEAKEDAQTEQPEGRRRRRRNEA